MKLRVIALPIILLLLALGVGGGYLTFKSRIDSDLGFIAGLQVSPGNAAILVNSYDAFEAVATTYIELPTCVATTSPAYTPACKTPAAVTALVQAVRAGRTARDALWSLVQADPSANIPIGSFNTLKTAVAALTTIANEYDISP